MNDVVVLVTGASRGVGRGIALALLAEGATVHVTGRTRSDEEAARHPQGSGSLQGLATEAANLPGKLVLHPCNHAREAETEAVVSTILETHRRIDILVNNAWPGYENMVEGTDFTWPRPFWEQPMWRWQAMMDVAVKTVFVASRLAAPAMVARQRGLIVNISFWAGELYEGNAIYGVSKAAANKLAFDFAHDLRPHGVAAVALYPGVVRTEAVLRAAEFIDLSNSESPQFTGYVIAGLWRDPNLMQKSGKVHVAANLAQEYGILDVDGRQPVPITADAFKR
jgi:NAD(P)-dependent dehydrogenase (short-subunit alcohol dehydrogenase family)